MEKELTDKELRNIYSRFVENEFFYRAVSEEYLPSIKKFGLTPEKNPFEDFKKELRQFLNIVASLDKRGYKIVYAWHHEVPPLSKLLRVLRKDLRKKYLDLSPILNENKYYLKRRGGSLVTTILELAELIKKNNYPLNKKQEIIFNKVVLWCKKKSEYKMLTLKIKRISVYLEKAYFQHFGGKYWASPFGSFENFKKVINREGLEKYLPFLEGKKDFYLRLSKTVPAIEIILAREKFLSFSREDLDKVFENYNLADLINLFKRDFAETFSSDVGVVEGYNLSQHVMMVLNQFDKYFSNKKLPGNMNQELFRVLLVLHDIGKPDAVKDGDKHLQHEYTIKMVREILNELNFSIEEINLSLALIDGDPVGKFIRHGDLDYSKNKIINKARQTNLSLSDFFDLLIVYYKCDAGSYTEDSGGEKALDHLFIFDSTRGKLNFSFSVKSKVRKLQKFVLEN